MSEELSVFLDGVAVARIRAMPGRKLRLSYTKDALDAHPLGTPLLSLSLPLTPEYYPHGIVKAFLDGLLPEGEPRRAIAERLNVKASDTYSLAEELGRDCAGALVILPPGERLPSRSTTRAARPLSQTELEDLVANLRSSPLGISSNVRLSLAGVQDKLTLARTADGSWALPNADAPSTHILKPEIAAYPRTVDNEAYCMRLAKHLGLSVAVVETIAVNDRSLIVVERFDRIVHGDGSVERVHQEDFCQALAISPEKKYQENGGPSLRRIAQVLDPAGIEALGGLLKATVVNVLVGNGDAHGKNFSLVHRRPGDVELAPLYDLVSTSIYGEKRLAMHIDKVEKIENVTSDRLINEAATWGLPRPQCRVILEDLLRDAGEAATAAGRETPDVPERLVRFVDAQVAKLSGTLD